MTQILQGLDIADTFLLSDSPTQGGTLAFFKKFSKKSGGEYLEVKGLISKEICTSKELK